MLKQLDPTAKSFVANGVEYFIEYELNVTRFMEYEKLQGHVAFGIDFQTMFSKLKELWETYNKQKFADGAVIIHNLMSGISRNIEKRYPPVMLLCTLFINTKDEDRTKWNEESANKKIEDWKEYDTKGFFQLAVSLITGFGEAYNEVILNTFATVGQDMNTTKSEV